MTFLDPLDGFTPIILLVLVLWTGEDGFPNIDVFQ